MRCCRARWWRARRFRGIADGCVAGVRAAVIVAGGGKGCSVVWSSGAAVSRPWKATTMKQREGRRDRVTARHRALLDLAHRVHDPRVTSDGDGFDPCSVRGGPQAQFLVNSGRRVYEPPEGADEDELVVLDPHAAANTAVAMAASNSRRKRTV